MGTWLLAVGVPLALGTWWWSMLRDAARLRSSTRDEPGSIKNRLPRGSLQLFSISILFPLLFALLINPKPFNYLITIVPLFCLILAVGFSRLLSNPRRMVQIFAGCI